MKFSEHRSVPPSRLLALSRQILLASLWSSALLAAEVPVPELRARVTDRTATLDQASTAVLEERLKAFEDRTGSQIAVLVISTTAPQEIEQYALRVVEASQLGREGIDDGALLLVALEDRNVRIEVGYGLEGALTDLVSRRIISESILPSFRSGDIPGGIELGVDRLIAVAEGEDLPDAQSDWDPGPLAGLRGLLPFLLILAFIGGTVLRAVLGRFWGSLASGSVVGFVAWLVSGLIGVASLAAFITFFALLLGGSRTGGGRWSSHPRAGRSSGGWSGGGFGGGGFSGGGGSFGGGGASGSW